MGITSSRPSTAQVSRRKQDERERLVAEMEELLGVGLKEGDQEILESSAQDIVQHLKDKKAGWTAQRVMEAYIRAACAAHRKTNCLTEILFREALETAKMMDKEEERSGGFWGLPSSFKDTYNIVGVDSSLGCSPHCFKPTRSKGDEAGLVQLYRRGGGIPFCKTNIPQTLLAFECSNPIWGPSSNPFDSTRVPGGSSGGEAALLALGGSPIGWGSDIGGSLRIPAAYSGCCGLKPVRGRWAISGQRNSVVGFDGILGMVGPMANNVTDLTYQSKVMIDLAVETPDAFDGEQLMVKPWRDEKPKQLRVGWYTDSAGVKTSPACARAVNICKEALKKAGHDIIPFNVPNPLEPLKVFAGLTSSDGYRQPLSNIGSDPMEPSLKLVTLGSKLPWVIHLLICWIVKTCFKDSVFAGVFSKSAHDGSDVETSRPKSVGEFWKFTHRRNEYSKLFRRKAWSEANLDAIICPVQAVPALEHGRTKFLSPLAISTIMYNVVDSTVGVLPVTTVDRDLDRIPADFLQGSNGSWILEKRVYRTSNPAYDADKMHGLPVGVQVVGRAWEEERVLSIMGELEGLVGYRKS